MIHTIEEKENEILQFIAKERVSEALDKKEVCECIASKKQLTATALRNKVDFTPACETPSSSSSANLITSQVLIGGAAQTQSSDKMVLGLK